MSKFKVGQRVKNDFNGVGEIKEVELHSPVYRVEFDSGLRFWHAEHDLAPIEKTLETLEVGDAVTHPDGGERFVLAGIGNILFLSDEADDSGEFSDDSGQPGWVVSVNFLKKYSWRPKQPDSESEQTVELTVSEISKKLNIPNLRIIEEGKHGN